MAKLSVLFYSGLVFSLFAVIVSLILPNTGLEALGGALAAHMAWLYHVITLPVVIFTIWRSKFQLFNTFVLIYYLLISLSGLVVVFLTTGTDEVIREKIEASSDSSGHEIRKISKTIRLQAMQGQPLDEQLESRLIALLAESPDLNHRGVTTEPALWYLAAAGEEELIQLLIEHGARVEDRELYDSSPLYVAADNGHSEAVRVLVDAGADINSEYRNFTPLMAAIRNGSQKTVDVLLEADADVNKMAHEGTAFSIALHKGDAEIVRALLKAGSNTRLSNHNKPAIYVAYERKYDDIVQALVEFGDGWNQQDEETKPALLYLYDDCHMDAFQSALDSGADPNLFVEKDSEDVLAYLIKNHAEKCDVLPFVNTLVEMGADVNSEDQHQQSLLILALTQQLLDVASLLAEHGASCDAYDGLQDSVLTLAVRNHMLALATRCLQQGSDMNYRSPLNNSSYALLEAVKSKKQELVDFTFENGAVLPNSETDMHNLFRHVESEQMVTLLLQHYASVKDPDRVLLRGIKSGLRNSKLPNKNKILSHL